MESSLSALAAAMIDYDRGDPQRIHHFLKVHAFARLLGQEEQLDPHTQAVLEAAALVHDIGIHPAEARYGSSAGKYQEELGPAEAETLLSHLGWPPEDIARIAYLVGHHHTYTHMDGADYQLLVEADFLVNLHEDQIPPEVHEPFLESSDASYADPSCNRKRPVEPWRHQKAAIDFGIERCIEP